MSWGDNPGKTSWQAATNQWQTLFEEVAFLDVADLGWNCRLNASQSWAAGAFALPLPLGRMHVWDGASWRAIT
jgi:hypothetical protein